MIFLKYRYLSWIVLILKQINFYNGDVINCEKDILDIPPRCYSQELSKSYLAPLSLIVVEKFRLQIRPFCSMNLKYLGNLHNILETLTIILDN